jgi:hypothetical protein
VKYNHLAIYAVLTLALLAGCGGDETPQGHSSSDAGWLSEDAGDSGAADSDSNDSGAADSGAVDLDASDSGAADSDSNDSGAVDSGSLDSQSGDVESDGADADQFTGRTLSDYRRCFNDIDCPVGLGVCVREVSLNRANPDGSDTVAMSDIFPSLQDGEGLCTLDCTNNVQVCGALSVNGTSDDPIPHTCQLVVLGDAVYPEVAPAFPFDDQLDPAEQAAGQPFGAICRPPFALDPAVGDSFCAPCEGPGSCGADSICWSLLDQAAAVEGEAGTCLSVCAADGSCPLGFACDVTGADSRSYCRPALGTCTNCQDVDGDGYGAGLCGPDASITTDDCDDRNPDAYFEPTDTQHAFPDFCGAQDFNCNGLSDAAEQVGTEEYGAEHCSSCFDACQGPVANGVRSCGVSGDSGVSQPICSAYCERDLDGNPLFADCDGDITNGCEVSVDDPNKLYYRDIDGDGFGDPNDVQFACGADVAPNGYVHNSLDCDDSSSAAHGGPNAPVEICDGLDNDCDGQVDEALAQVGVDCSTGLHGVCDLGDFQCDGANGWVCEPRRLPDDFPESCRTDADDDCDGEVNESDAADSQTYYYDGDGDGYGDTGRWTAPIRICPGDQPAGYISTGGDCNDTAARTNPGQDERCGWPGDDNCNGLEDNADPTATDKRYWYGDSDEDGYGDPAEKSLSETCYAHDNFVVSNDDDCNDASDAAYPGAQEVCSDNLDNNCDGNQDELPAVGTSIFYKDADNDSFGNVNATIEACVEPADYSPIKDFDNDGAFDFDCNDSNDQERPDGVEVCDGLDNDCSGDADTGCPAYNSGNVSYVKRVGNVDPQQVLGSNQLTTHSEGTRECPNSSVWVGGRVNYILADVPIFEVDLFCHDFVIEKTTQTATGTYSYSLDSISAPIAEVDGFSTPWSGGEFDEFQCPAGEAIYKVDVTYGQVIDNITFYCRPYDITGSIGNFSIYSSASVGSGYSYGGDPYNTPPGRSTAECDADDVAVGGHFIMAGYEDDPDAFTRFVLHCQSLEPLLQVEN